MRPNLFTYLERGLAQTKKYGLRLVWNRYWTRPRILKTKPIPCPADSPLEVHTMVCNRDWLNGVWTLKSFRATAGQPFRLVVFQDGSLSPESLAALQHHFPGVEIPSQPSLAPLLRERLGTVAPTLVKLWESGKCFILRKTMDSWIAAQRRWVLKIVPDVLSFPNPGRIASS